MDICGEKHKRIDEKMSIQDKRLDNHGDRLDVLERYQSKAEEQIKNLCEQIKSLVTTIKWSMGLLVTTLVGFIIWYIQNLS